MELNQNLISRDYSKLPEKYWKKQNLCWYLHDVIVSMFKKAIDEISDGTKIEIKDEKDAIEFEKSDDVYGWLKEKGRDEEFTHILCKDLSMRLLGDFLNYVHEALSNLERGKITIAYDLLRKPFKDNLLYLEWILFNGKELSNLAYNGEIDKYALGRSELDKKYVKNIVLDNVLKNRFISRFKNRGIEESIYDIRYNYNSPNSLELVWNKATHLVTTNRKIRTKDFNFLYYNDIDYDNYWSYWYGKVPLLLLYTIGIVENIFDEYFIKIKATDKTYNHLLIMGKFFAANEKSKEYADELINLIDGQLHLPCENCKMIVKLKKPESYVFYNYWDVMCPICKNDINVCKYFFLE